MAGKIKHTECNYLHWNLAKTFKLATGQWEKHLVTKIWNQITLGMLFLPGRCNLRNWRMVAAARKLNKTVIITSGGLQEHAQDILEDCGRSHQSIPQEQSGKKLLGKRIGTHWNVADGLCSKKHRKRTKQKLSSSWQFEQRLCVHMHVKFYVFQGRINSHRNLLVVLAHPLTETH